ncbi:MAG: ATP-binding protein [Desulfobulbaceae bacterium]|nr:ATP-binding protein [Desulfobulbaceae bacterium]
MSKPDKAHSADRQADRCTALEKANQQYIRYIREKTNQLLGVMGTQPLRPEELDDRALIDLDPIGIIADSFAQVFEFLNENISELRQAKDELQAIFDATGVGISIIDREFTIQRCNEMQRELLVDPSLTDVAGRYCYEIYCNKEVPGMDCPAVETFATGQPVVVREVKKKDKYFQVVTTPYARSADDEVSKVIEVSLDITEKKKAEAAEKEQREYYLTEKAKLATVIESLSEGLLVLDPEDRVVVCNRAAAAITGCGDAELLGQPLAALFPVSAPLAGGEGNLQGVEISYPARGGASELLLSANVGHLLDAENQSIGKVVTFRDITQEKRRQELLHRTEKLAAIGQLSAGVAHELNTPLGSILGYARLLLKDKDLSAAQKERLAIIAEQAKKSSTIIQALLSFARHSAHSRRALGACNLNTVIDKALPILNTELVKRKIELVSEQQPLPPIMADPVELEQIVLNLLLNALQAIGRQGRIVISTRHDGQRVVMEVEDNGPGIAEDIRTRIFDPFYTTKPIGEGTGLGLSICAGIVDDYGGSMEVASTPGGGATFIVFLPAFTEKTS